MIRLIPSACIVALLACAALPAAAATGPARQCFFARDLSSWKEVGDRTVNLRVGVSDLYQLDLLAPCPDLPWAEAIGIETRGGSNQICSGLDVSLIVPASVTRTVPQRCMATSLRKLSKAEADALPRSQRP